MAKQPEPHPFLVRLSEGIERLANEMERYHMYQLEEASKTADNYVTVHGIIVPEQSQLTPFPSQIAPGRVNRKTIIISNTGGHACCVGNTPDNALGNGFTIANGSMLSVDTQDAFFAWVPSSNTTTLDILETLYDLHRTFKVKFKTQVGARYDDQPYENNPEIETARNTGVDENTFRGTVK